MRKLECSVQHDCHWNIKSNDALAMLMKWLSDSCNKQEQLPLPLKSYWNKQGCIGMYREIMFPGKQTILAGGVCK